MRFLGFTISRKKSLRAPSGRGGWWPAVRESFTGAWQRGIEVKKDTVLSFHAVFACQTLIASDIAKLRIKLVRQRGELWTETTNQAYSPVLRKPNHFQNRIQFLENWVLSKLQAGNTYILKQRDGRNVVTALYVLDPGRVKPLVADDGSVYYELNTDHLAGLSEAVVVPASEIIHDRFNCFFHPLVGLSPIYANGLAATQGLSIQNNSARFFASGSNPGGILTAPGEISQETAARLKAHWDENYTGENVGKVAVLGDGLKYESMTVKAVDAQLIEQLKWSAEVVCSTYHVPPYKIGIGAQPTFNNVQSLNIEYYSQCLQVHIEAIELCLDEGLGTPAGTGTELDVENLLRMDSVTQMEVLKEGVGAGLMSPNEGRAKIGQRPVPGGETPYLQQQNYSLAALAKRDARDDPFDTSSSTPPEPATPPADTPPPEPDPQTERGAQVIDLWAVRRRAKGNLDDRLRRAS
ncbi:phage portal protein [Sphingomonas azotifigens]|uniref:phage portal protein n=1 Tax=Sphingomonas azotifigens TaxID=330920 RepID=UPI000A0674BC|nr:phage portal protein [Sphingomonas azotifigens]